MEGKTEMTPAEPVGPIHMPSPSILPLFMSLGLFIAALGFMYSEELNGYVVAIGGLVITFFCMFLRSVYDDHGFHIDPTEDDKGVGA